MAILQDLLSKIEDVTLRERIAQEVEKMTKSKKFGLVFEEHIPECTPLYDLAYKVGSKVALKGGFIKDVYIVKAIGDEEVVCEHKDTHEEKTFKKDELVAVAEFGEAIYPYLKPVDSICNAPDSDLWHTLIEADNYHALQLLEYLYAGKVNCIYIDPPYNTGAKDWKYNNAYVDSSDAYRHSKWLSMMEKRLKVAKKLLNHNDSVLIVTIDEKEYLHLGCLLEQMFPEANMQMISSVVNPSGVSRGGEFYRTDEYLFFIKFGTSAPIALNLSNEWITAQNSGKDKLRWRPIRRQGSHDTRADASNQFYPIFLTSDGKHFAGVGETLPIAMKVDDYVAPNDKIALWPMKPDGKEGCWQISQDNFLTLCEKGYTKISYSKKWGYVVKYLAEGERKKVEKGQFPVIGNAEDGSIITDHAIEEAPFIPGTQWRIHYHSAREFGSTLINNFLQEKRFDFPKSLYAVHDALRFFVANKPNALIVDFFAGSGTTLHAVNLLNAEDGGHRRCILVTNNEVSDEEAKTLTKQGLHPGDEEWEKLGIARYVTWPRTTCCIKGIDVAGKTLEGEYITYETQEKVLKRNIKQLSITIDDGNYLKLKKQLVGLVGKGQLPQSLVNNDSNYIVTDDSEVTILFNDQYMEEWLDEIDGRENLTDLYIVTTNDKLFKSLKEEIDNRLGDYTKQVPKTIPMSEGFKANAIYFELGFLDKMSVALGRQFREMLPLLWMKAGAIGKCPTLEGEDIPDMLILPENRFAVLVNENEYGPFLMDMSSHPDIKTIYFITDSEPAYQSMAYNFAGVNTYQLNKDYLQNFTINIRRQS